MRADVHLSDAMVDQSLDLLDQRLRLQSLLETPAWRPTPVCDVSLLRRDSGDHTFVYLKQACHERLVGFVSFHHAPLRGPQGWVRVAVPHSKLRRQVRGLGLARWVYGEAIRGGTSLLSSARQSTSAVRLWRSLGRSCEGLDVWVEGRTIALLDEDRRAEAEGSMQARRLLHPPSSELPSTLQAQARARDEGRRRKGR